ncbi:MAG TPA: L-lactate permease [Alphaproteobacteria bacterium]|nr:L-lactate permease [Alphaproteobacteria bacterium]
MIDALYLLPLAAVVALLASGRAKLLTAGIVGLALTLPAVWLARPGAGFGAFLLVESLRGAWIAWQAIAVILAGLVFFQVIKAAQPALFAPAAATAEPRRIDFSHRELFAACFLAAPFAESATGFGVGAIIAVSLLSRMGLGGVPAVVFALFSQILVPWGALAISTVVGAALAHMPLAMLGERSALLAAAILLGDLAVFWLLCRRFHRPPRLGEAVDDLAWLAALALLLWLINRHASVEIAGLAATGTLLVLRYLRDHRPSPRELGLTLRRTAPYLALTLALVATRLIAPLAHALRTVLPIQPAPDLPAFAPLYHVGAWLLLVALVYGWAMGVAPSWRGILTATWRAGRIPTAVTLVFIVMAQLMAAAGIAGALARGWSALAGSLALAATPVFGAVAGFLTGSNVASNGIMMPLQTALAAQAGADPSWIAAIQNVAGADFTLLSPVRVAMAAALLGLGGAEREVYRRALPIGVVILIVLTAAAFILR